jgi:hypothetical protein
VRKLVIGIQALLGLMFLGSAISKLTGGADDMRADLEIASWFWTLTALVEIVGAAGLLVALKFHNLAAPAGLWIVALMTGAVIAHLRVGDFSWYIISPIVLLSLALVIVRVNIDTFRAMRATRTG